MEGSEEQWEKDMTVDNCENIAVAVALQSNLPSTITSSSSAPAHRVFSSSTSTTQSGSKHATQMCCQACSASSYTTASPLHLAHRLQRPVGQFIDARLATSVIHIHHSQAHLIIAPHVLPVRVVRLKVAAHA